MARCNKMNLILEIEYIICTQFLKQIFQLALVTQVIKIISLLFSFQSFINDIFSQITEAMAPPSYEEVMAIQYPPGFQQGQQPQPITQPITHAMAQGSTSTEIPAVHTVTNNTSNGNARCTEVVTTAPAIVTVTNEERRTSVTVSARA